MSVQTRLFRSSSVLSEKDCQGKQNGLSTVCQDMGTKERQFQALVEAYSATLYRFAYWLCGDRCVAEDLVQEVFTRAWRSLGSLRNEAAAKSWLLTILHRENARRFERETPLTVDIDCTQLEELKIPGPDSDLERSIFHRAILQLKSDYREPLAMQIIGGYSYEEIAEALGLEKSAVVMRLYRAKQKLAEVIANPEKSDSLSEYDGRS